jgi:hypothetical protein
MPSSLRAKINLRETLEGHTAKMMGALLTSAVQASRPGVAERVAAMPDLAALLTSVAQQAGQENLSKKRGLYADLMAGGELSLPSDVTEAEAVEAAARAREVGESAALLHDQDALAAFADVSEEAQQALDAMFTGWAALSGIEDADAAAVVIADFARRAAATVVPSEP